MDRRRLLLIALAGAVAAPGVGAAAQQIAKTRRVGMLWYGRSLDTRRPVIEAFTHSLSEQGFVAGQNLAIEHRHSGATLHGLPALAAELVRSHVEVIVAIGPVAIRSARQVTTTVPIVMLNGDPAMFANLARPAGHVTGLTALAAELAGKQMDLVKDFEAAFATATRARAGALIVPADGTYALHHRALTDLAARHRLRPSPAPPATRTRAA